MIINFQTTAEYKLGVNLGELKPKCKTSWCGAILWRGGQPDSIPVLNILVSDVNEKVHGPLRISLYTLDSNASSGHQFRNIKGLTFHGCFGTKFIFNPYCIGFFLHALVVHSAAF